MLNFSARLTEDCTRSKSARPGDQELFFSRPKQNVSCLRRPGTLRAQPWAAIPLQGGGGLGSCFPRKFWHFKALKCDFQCCVDSKLGTKERVFHSRKCSFHSTFYLSVTQSIPTGIEQMMKTKLPTFAHKQILRKPLKKLVKNWLKYCVHMTKT